MEEIKLPFRDMFPMNLRVHRESWLHIHYATLAGRNQENFYEVDGKRYELTDRQAKLLNRIWKENPTWLILLSYPILKLFIEDRFLAASIAIGGLLVYMMISSWFYYPYLAKEFMKEEREA